MSDYDTTGLMLFSEDGNALGSATWPQARDHIATLLSQGNANEGYAYRRADEILRAVFGGPDA